MLAEEQSALMDTEDIKAALATHLTQAGDIIKLYIQDSNIFNWGFVPGPSNEFPAFANTRTLSEILLRQYSTCRDKINFTIW